ncbi:aspartate kinase [bacterium]|nr:aspartate kinase [bacterium]
MRASSQSLVLKFGGAAVSSPERFHDIANIIKTRAQSDSPLIVVVSAMGETTDELITLAHKVHPNPPARELDMLVSVGERISISLLAMALARIGLDAVSFTGSQSGILTNAAHTEARIIEIKPQRILSSLIAGKIAIVAGFQGVCPQTGDITTLGRGGSDTTAVALAAALSSKHVEFYKDVEGIFDSDPKNSLNAKKYDFLSFADALKLTRAGAQVLQPRCIEIADRNAIPLWVLPFAQRSETPSTENLGTWIGLEECQIKQHPRTPCFEVG